MNAPLLSLLQLMPGEAEAVALLTRFTGAHPGVTILTPHYSDEPWRAEIREGGIPGEGGATSAFLTARQPSELLAKLEEIFPPGSERQPGGDQSGAPGG